MHTIKLNIPDSVYSDFISFLKKYPNLQSYIAEDENRLDFVVSSMDEAQQRVEKARDSIKKGIGIEEDVFWQQVDNHLAQ